MIRSVAPLLLLAGCPKAGGRVPELGWEELFVPSRYDYSEITVPEGGDPIRTTVTETWTPNDEVPAPEGFPGAVWTVEDAPDDGPPTWTLFVAGEKGLAYFATIGHHGQVRSFAPKVLLPARIEGRASWEGSHGEGPGANTRSCHVEPTPYCEAGVAVACETHWTGRAVWMRQHFCRGLGWVGYESVSRVDGQTTLTWSEEATRDGEPLPLVGIELRPLPEVSATTVAPEDRGAPER